MTHRPCFSCFLPQQRCHTHTITCQPNGHGQTVARAAHCSGLTRTLRTCMRVKNPMFLFKEKQNKKSPRESSLRCSFCALIMCEKEKNRRERCCASEKKENVRLRERERSQCLHVCRFPALSVSCQSVIYGCETHSSPCCQFSIVTTDI